jgi:hypothetical protein
MVGFIPAVTIKSRHCERSEEIQRRPRRMGLIMGTGARHHALGCFASLAMTGEAGNGGID